MSMGDDERRQVPVKVTNFEEMVFRTEEHEPEHFSMTTVTLQPGQNPGNGPQTLLPLDPLRKKAWIYAVDAPIVLCDSPAQASAAGNQVAGFTAPDGAYWPMTTLLPVEGTGHIWAACQAATRVTVITTRRKS